MRFLDFTKVRDVERKKAQELFGTTEEPTELAKQVRAMDGVLIRVTGRILIHTDLEQQIKRLRGADVYWRRRLGQGAYLHGR